jgi:hypothetical protein
LGAEESAKAMVLEVSMEEEERTRIGGRKRNHQVD